LRKLLEIENVVGVKDSSGDLIQIREIMETAPKPITFINGHDRILFAALMMGAKAQISGTANVAPELLVGVYEHYKKGEYKEALDLQTKIDFVARTLAGPPISKIKKALELRGVKAGLPKRPLRPLTQEETSGLEEKLKALDLFW